MVFSRRNITMLNQIYYHAANTSAVTTVIIPIALMLFLGFCMTRITKQLRLPNVTAYILTGILIGPYCLNLIPQNFIQGSDFLADIALAFIAFSVGEFFKLSTLKKNGLKSAVITLFEALMASLTVFIMTYFILHLNMAFSIVLAALASATAPASTIMTIRQTGAHGDFVDTLLQVVAMDDVVGLIAYSVAISIAVSSLSGASSGNIFETMLLPILTNLFALVLGGSFAFLMKMLISTKRSTDNRLIISVSILFLFCGICAVLDVSPLLGCMAMGMVYINITEDDKLFKQLNYFNPPILLLFFVRSGVSFNLGILTGSGSLVGNVSVLTVGILYFITRIIGKYAGAFLGCLITGKSAEVRNYLGLALYLSHSYSDVLENLTEVSETTDSGTPKTQVEILIERLQQIQEELPSRLMMENDAEQAFTQAAEEQYENYGTYSTYSKGHFLNLK